MRFNSIAGRVLESMSDICYTLLLILLGKGYTVTRARLKAVSIIKVTTFMSLYCVTYIALFSYERMASAYRWTIKSPVTN